MNETRIGTHTPGPWIVEGYQVYGPLDGRSRHRNGRLLVGGVVDDLNDWRAQPSETPDERSEFKLETCANARLVASAPDLLDALIIALPYVESAENDDAYKPGAVAKVVREMRAAIAKAEGTPGSVSVAI